MTTFTPTLLNDDDLADQGEALLEALVEDPTVETALAFHALGKAHHGTTRYRGGGCAVTHFLHFAPLTAPYGDYWLESSHVSIFRLILAATPIVTDTPPLRLRYDVEVSVKPVVETYDTNGGADRDHLLVTVAKGGESFTLAYTDESPVGDLLYIVEEAAWEAGRSGGTVEEVEAIVSAGTYAAAALMFTSGADLAAASPALR